jgi:hypothetical protein
MRPLPLATAFLAEEKVFLLRRGEYLLLVGKPKNKKIEIGF